MFKEWLTTEIRLSREFFERSTRVLSEDDSKFSPSAEMMTVAQQVAHAASSIEWFLDGAFNPKGFDMDFEKHNREIESVTSLKEARAWLDRAYASVLDKLSTVSDADLTVKLPAGPVMGGAPRARAFYGVVEHTAHHRGALTVYARLRGKEPKMPYMEL